MYHLVHTDCKEAHKLPNLVTEYLISFYKYQNHKKNFWIWGLESVFLIRGKIKNIYNYTQLEKTHISKAIWKALRGL